MKRRSWGIISTLFAAAAGASAAASAGGRAAAVLAEAGAQSAASVPPVSVARAARFTADGRLEFPDHYREWIFLSSGLDMRYTEEGGNPGHSMFDNVFVDPRAYREFLRTGEWADGTVLVLENRGAAEQGSINRHGKYQTRDVMGLEVHVKDARRFPGGWAFVAFRGRAPAAAIPQSADCYSCHREHGAVDTTFVQFYPTLIETAARKGTFAAER